ncbi:MAG: hypothetical protein M5U05_03670 [Anaerolineales bacterium]|nr:hypothetical protein [Anaerolineales bacterium]
MERVLINIKGRLSSRWLPWAIIGSGLLAVVLFGVSSSIRLENPPNLSAFALGLLLLCGLLLALWIVQGLLSLVAAQRQLSAALNESEKRLEDAYQRLETIFRVSQKFLEANDENDVIELVLNLLVELTGAQGAAFVPLDEHGQPQATISRGALPPTEMDGWLEHLASPGVRALLELRRQGRDRKASQLSAAANSPAGDRESVLPAGAARRARLWHDDPVPARA